MRFIHRRLCHSSVVLRWIPVHSDGSQSISNKRGFPNCKVSDSTLHVTVDDVENDCYYDHCYDYDDDDDADDDDDDDDADADDDDNGDVSHLLLVLAALPLHSVRLSCVFCSPLCC